MSYIPPEVVAKAKQMDLYTYLKTYEPQELVHFAGSTYCTREHDSLKISNGKWYWFSRGIGGRSALDYLIKVKGIPFMEAVEVIVDWGTISPPAAPSIKKESKVKSLCLPEASRCATHAVNYLAGRGIDRDLLDFCLSTGRLYESQKYHNVVFVGQDKYGKPRYANLRGIGTDFKGEASGSDKRFSFSIPAAEDSDTLHLFESAIDLLSYATLRKQEGMDWQTDHMISLAGVYRPRAELRESSMPMALTQYLKDHLGIQKIVLRLDNDYAGRMAAKALTVMLSDQYDVAYKPPPQGKDYNDFLCMRLGKPVTKTAERSAAR